MYRKQHKKDIHAEAVRKKRRATKKPYSRSIVGASLEVIQKRTEKAEVRDAAREAALREIKERIKKTKDEKKAKKAEVTAKTQKTQSKVTKGRQEEKALSLEEAEESAELNFPLLRNLSNLELWQ
ncbi:60S ribosomal protein L24 [Iris pallida]|uniref:60S ribosomal protein L24 n=1 Tax=Iris pallida TaxID=29817 RepID=A0AAX6IE89_IRIPA|nr:60S ribosomal protein L24 [Iris pallida]